MINALFASRAILSLLAVVLCGVGCAGGSTGAETRVAIAQPVSDQSGEHDMQYADVQYDGMFDVELIPTPDCSSGDYSAEQEACLNRHGLTRDGQALMPGNMLGFTFTPVVTGLGSLVLRSVSRIHPAAVGIALVVTVVVYFDELEEKAYELLIWVQLAHEQLEEVRAALWEVGQLPWVEQIGQLVTTWDDTTYAEPASDRPDVAEPEENCDYMNGLDRELMNYGRLEVELHVCSFQGVVTVRPETITWRRGLGQTYFPYYVLNFGPEAVDISVQPEGSRMWLEPGFQSDTMYWALEWDETPRSWADTVVSPTGQIASVTYWVRN